MTDAQRIAAIRDLLDGPWSNAAHDLAYDARLFNAFETFDAAFASYKEDQRELEPPSFGARHPDDGRF